MKIVFMGTPQFAVASLDELIKPEPVITARDKPADAGRRLPSR
ncbi:hypothetical protein [Mucilaginibacter humi]|nr:hypothetical protein [Mucilaginibacter humi]